MRHVVWQQFPGCSGEKNKENTIQHIAPRDERAPAARTLWISGNKGGEFRPEFIGKELVNGGVKTSQRGGVKPGQLK